MGVWYRRYYIFEGLADAIDELVEWCGVVGISGKALSHPTGHLVFTVTGVDLRPHPICSIDPEVALPPLDADIERLLANSVGMIKSERLIRASVGLDETYGAPLREAQTFLAFASRHDTRLFRYIYSDVSYTCGVVDFDGKRLFDAVQHTLTFATPNAVESGDYPAHHDPDDPHGLLEDYDQEELDACEEIATDPDDPFNFSIETWDDLCRELMWHYARPILPDQYADWGEYGALSALIDPDYFFDDFHDVDEAELDDDYVHPDLWREENVEPPRCEACSGAGTQANRHGSGNVICGDCCGTGVPGQNVRRYQESVKAVNDALDRLEAMLAADRTISDEDYLGVVREHNEHLAETVVTVVSSEETVDLEPLIRDFERAFVASLPIDLVALLSRWNGIAVGPAGRRASFDQSCFLSTAEIMTQWSVVLDWEVGVPALPFAVTWPSGPVLALMIDESDGPYRVVTFESENADEELHVVGEHLGDVVAKYVDSGLSVLETSQRTIDTVRLPARETPQPEPQAAARIRRSTPGSETGAFPPELAIDDEADAMAASAASGGDRPLPPIVKEKDGLRTGPPPESIRYWESLLMCVLAPGLAHIVSGQAAKGALIIAIVICTFGAGWLLAPLFAFDLHKVRRAQTNRDVGSWEFFPDE